MTSYSATREGSSISGYGRDYRRHPWVRSRSSSLERRGRWSTIQPIFPPSSENRLIISRRARSFSRSRSRSRSRSLSRTRVWRKSLVVTRSRSPSLRLARPLMLRSNRSRTHSHSRSRSRSLSSERRDRRRTLVRPNLTPKVVKASRETTITKYSVAPRPEILPVDHHHHHHCTHHHCHHHCHHYHRPRTQVTFIRVSVRDICPETLDHFGYPWEWASVR